MHVPTTFPVAADRIKCGNIAKPLKLIGPRHGVPKKRMAEKEVTLDAILFRWRHNGSRTPHRDNMYLARETTRDANAIP